MHFCSLVLADLLIVLMMNRFTRFTRVARAAWCVSAIVHVLNVRALSYAVLLSRVGAPFVYPRRTNSLPVRLPVRLPAKMHIP